MKECHNLDEEEKGGATTEVTKETSKNKQSVLKRSGIKNKYTDPEIRASNK